ncbi:MAG: restriction endonuclease subunit S [Methanobacterium sp.]
MIKEDFLKNYTELISSGSTPKGGSDNYLDDGEIIFIRSQNVLMNKFSDHDALYIPLDIHEKMKRTWVKNRDVLINITGASIGRTTVYVGEDNKANVNQHVCIIRLKDFKTIDPFYLSFFLSSNSFQKHIVKINAGATRQALNFSQIGKFKIPIPPIETQKQIVEMIRKAEKMKEWRAEANDLTDDYLKSVFLVMFGDPRKNPMEWPLKKAEEICLNEKNAIKAGPFGSSLKKEFYVDTGYKIYGQEQVIKDDFEYGDYYISEERYQKLKNCKIKTGDILISLVGTYGKISIVPENFEPGIINPRLMKISLNQKVILPEYFKCLLLSEGMKARIENLSHGGTMGILNVKIIKQLKFPIPPIDIQKQFLELLNQLETIKNHQFQSKQQINNLFNTLMQKAFKGELIC